MTPTAEQIVAKGRELVGTPWGHQGRMDHQGAVDCIGLWIWVAHELGIPVHGEDDAYGRAPVARRLEAAMERHFTRLALADIRPADAVLIKFPRAPRASHVAMVVDNAKHGLGLVHALNGYRDRGRVIEHHLDASWRQKIASAWRLHHLAG